MPPSLLELPHQLSTIAALVGVVVGTVTRDTTSQDFKSDTA